MSADGLLGLGTVLAGGSSDGGMTPSTVTPGLPAFFTMFVLAVATVLLVVDMTRRVRRTQARERVAAREAAREAELNEGEGADGTAAESDSVTGPDDAPEDGPSQGGAHRAE